LVQPETFAERTSGHCSISDEEKGRPVLSLLPGVTFYTAAPGQIKVKIWLEAFVKTADLYDEIRCMPGTKIFDRNRKLIGRVTEAFNPMQSFDPIDSLTPVIIWGYLEKSCLDNTFLPEEELSKILMKAGVNEKLETFLPYLQKFGLTQQSEEGEYTSYLLQEPEFTKQILVPRILMVFYKGELIAIFHTRSIQVKQYDSIEMGKQYKMIYNSKFSEHTKSEMVNIFRKKIS
jgi:hypothetical protein